MIRLWLAVGGARRACCRSRPARSRRISPAEPRAAELLRTGAIYGMVHAAALIAVIALAQGREPRRGAACGRGMELCCRHRVVQPQPVRAGADAGRAGSAG